MCIIRIAHPCCTVHLLNTRHELEQASPPLEAQARELITQPRDYTCGNGQLSIPLLRPMSVTLIVAFPQGCNGISSALEIFIHTLSSTHPQPRDHGRAERRGRGSRFGVHTGAYHLFSQFTLKYRVEQDSENSCPDGHQCPPGDRQNSLQVSGTRLREDVGSVSQILLLAS